MQQDDAGSSVFADASGRRWRYVRLIAAAAGVALLSGAALLLWFLLA